MKPDSVQDQCVIDPQLRIGKVSADRAMEVIVEIPVTVAAHLDAGFVDQLCLLGGFQIFGDIV